MGASSREELEFLKQELRGELTPAERAAIELQLGKQYGRVGAHDQALLHLTTARRLYDQLSDRSKLGATDAAMGATCGFKGESERARVYIERALGLADEIGDTDLKARALNRLAEQSHRSGEIERARELWSRARSHFEEHWDGAELAAANVGLALILASREQFEEAETLAARATDDAEASGDQFELGRALAARAYVAWKSDDAKGAKRYYRRAMSLFQTNGFRRELAEAYLQFGLFMGDAGDRLADKSDPPAYWLAKAQELFRELGGLHDLERVRDAFRNYGRRATDKVAEVEVLQLLQELKQNRMGVQRESHRLADLVTNAVDAVETRDGVMPQLDETRARISAVEQTLSRNLDEMALAEERFLGAVNAVVLERENIRLLLELTRSLSRVESNVELPTDIARMATQLSNADRSLVALVDDEGNIALRGAVNFEGDDAVAALASVDDVARRGGTAQLLFRTDDDDGDEDDEERVGGGRLDEAKQRQLRLGYGVVVPLRHGEDFYGVIYADKDLCGGVFTERDLDLLAVFAGQAAVVLENCEIQNALRLQARATAATLEAIRDGVVSFDGSGTLTSMNEEGARIIGVEYDAKKQSRLSRLPDLDFLRPCVTRGEEYDGRTVNLPTGDYLCSTRVIRADGGEVGVVVATFTELKRATSIAQRIVGSTARYSFGDIIGQSAALKRRLVLAEAAARSDSSVLITGESGTGKELFAQAIHNAGPRSGGPFVGINCAAIPRDLLESELFGYDSGAFTGARRGGRPGKFELAEGGTILLDEIGDMPLEMQAKLLRVLQERVTQRLGGTREIPLNCRVIGTTNRDLGAEVARGMFRQDLYFRLRVIHIDLPPLRTRPEDIEVLAQHFLQIYSARLGKAVHEIAPHIMDALRRYPWAGNIRELEHVLEGEVNLASDEQSALTEVPVMLESPTTPPAMYPPNSTPPNGMAHMPRPLHGGFAGDTAPFVRQDAPVVKSMSESEKELLVAALYAHRGNIPSVARSLGVSRGTVYNKMKKFNIDPTQYRGQ
jgi:transcriptional regulator with PAS, ATPase and Fis domain/tetratricopeptide (TPR) repeat protein